jgi:hypothetical protein
MLKLKKEINIFRGAPPLDNFNLKVYDHWGKIIFETNDIYEAWN